METFSLLRFLQSILTAQPTFRSGDAPDFSPSHAFDGEAEKSADGGKEECFHANKEERNAGENSPALNAYFSFLSRHDEVAHGKPHPTKK